MSAPSASHDLVIGLDSSTTATKAIAWDGHGMAVAEGRATIAMSSPHPGWFEQDPQDWWTSACAALREVTSQIDPARIGGLAISQQRETVGFFRKDGTPLRPGIVWLDERAKTEMRRFAGEFGADRLHEISGKPVDITVPVPLFVWLQTHEPSVWDAIDVVSDVGGFLTYRLTGRWATSRVSADPSGMIDMASLDWSPVILSALGLDTGRLAELHVPGDVIEGVSADAAALTGLSAGTPVIAGGGDGQCAGTGVNVLEGDIAYLNLGTAVVSGSYGTAYVHDRAFRTMGAVAERGYIYENCLRTGTFLIDWVVEHLFNLNRSAATYRMLEAEAAASPIGSNGLMLVPYWSGAMTPHWDMDARGIFAGFNASHRRGDIYRAVLEGMALYQAVVTDDCSAATGKAVDRYVAIGGGAASDLWCGIIADAGGRVVERSATVEASALGAGMAAAKGAGWFATIAAAAAAMSGAAVSRIEPNSERGARYGELLELYRDLWPAIADWNRRLARFAEGGR